MFSCFHFHECLWISSLRGTQGAETGPCSSGACSYYSGRLSLVRWSAGEDGREKLTYARQERRSQVPLKLGEVGLGEERDLGAGPGRITGWGSGDRLRGEVGQGVVCGQNKGSRLSRVEGLVWYGGEGVGVSAGAAAHPLWGFRVPLSLEVLFLICKVDMLMPARGAAMRIT